MGCPMQYHDLTRILADEKSHPPLPPSPGSLLDYPSPPYRSIFRSFFSIYRASHEIRQFEFKRVRTSPRVARCSSQPRR